MNIAVLIKQVPVSNDVSVDPETHALVRASSEGMINPADLNAIEEAEAYDRLIRDFNLKQDEVAEQTDGKVVVFTMGPPDAEKALRDAMALGCDESCLITDRAVAGGDTVATAKVLAKAIQLYGEFDLILGGALSADGATGQVAAMVAEELNLPHVVEIQSVKYKEDQAGKVEVVKKMHDTSFRIACATPAVLSVNFGCNEPRLATLRSKRAAKSKPLVTYTNAELGFAAEEIGIKGSPTVTVDSFQPETKRSAKMLTGTPAELAKQLYDLIEEEKGK